MIELQKKKLREDVGATCMVLHFAGLMNFLDTGCRKWAEPRREGIQSFELL
jgi:hypothetical protein